MKRLGLAGVGRWGQRYIDTIARRHDCRIVALTRAAVVNDQLTLVPGAAWYRDWSEMLARAQHGELDGLIVATTPENQAQIAEAAVAAGVPALVEKPLGLSRSAAEKVRDACGRKAPLLVGFVHLWAPAYQALHRTVKERRAAGERVVSITSTGCNAGPFREWSSLYDYGPHDVALALQLLGTGHPYSIQRARRSSPDARGELFDVHMDIGEVTVTLSFGNGGIAKRRTFAAVLSGGRTLVYDDTRPHPFKLTDDGSPVPVPTTSPLDLLLTEYVHCVELWATGKFPEQEVTRVLDFCVQVADILDRIGEASDDHPS